MILSHIIGNLFEECFAQTVRSSINFFYYTWHNAKFELQVDILNPASRLCVALLMEMNLVMKSLLLLALSSVSTLMVILQGGDLCFPVPAYNWKQLGCWWCRLTPVLHLLLSI